VQYFGHARDLGGSSSSGASVVASHQHVDLATALGGSSHGVKGGSTQRGVVMFGDYE
jgi:hypothetical protein